MNPFQNQQLIRLLALIIDACTQEIPEVDSKAIFNDNKERILELVKQEFPDRQQLIGEVLAEIELPEVKDGHTPTEKELLKLIKPLIPVVKDGKAPTKTELRELIKPLIPAPQKVTKKAIREVVAPMIPEQNKVIEKQVTEVVVEYVVTVFAEMRKDIAARTYDAEEIVGLDEYIAQRVSGDASETFEKISKNLKDYPFSINYTNGDITSIVYTIPDGAITKTIGYTNGDITTVTLSGDLPAGLSITTKTISYTNGDITGVSYS